MKPLEIEFAAFGSYPGTVTVDFAALSARGLFVVSGDTGTGKTTVFDAMSFALFGSMPLKPTRDIRSHHAEPTTHTYARFTFETGGATYVAERSPTYVRPATRGTGTSTRQAEASLSRLDGDNLTTLATRATEVRAQVEKLIGLNADQFMRVMVLPQGQVQRFLLDSSQDRQTLLSQLFGGDVFGTITEQLKEAKTAAENAVTEVETTLGQHRAVALDAATRAHRELRLDPPDDLATLDRAGLDDVLSTLTSSSTQLSADAATARAAADEAQTRATTAVAEAQRYDQAQQHRSTLDELAASETAILTAATAAERSATARPVVDADHLRSKARDEETAALEARDRRLDEIRTSAQPIGITFTDDTPVGITETLNETQAIVEAERSALVRHREAQTQVADARHALETWEAQVQAVRSAATDLDGRIAEIDAALAELADVPTDTTALDTHHEWLTTVHDLITQRNELASALATEASSENQAKRRVDATMQGYLASEAPRLAAELAAGEPCLVCGSTTHPAPARQDDTPITSYEEVEEAQQAFDQARTARAATERRLTALRAKLADDADTDLDEITVRLQETEAALAAAGQAIGRRTELTRRRADSAQQRDDRHEELSRLAGAEPGHRNAVEEAEAALRTAAEETRSIEPTLVEQRSSALVELRTARDRYERVVERAATAIAGHTQATELFETSLAASIFATADEAKAALLDIDEERDAIEARTQHQHARTGADAALQTLESQGIPETRPDTVTLEATAAAAEQDAVAIGERSTLTADALQRLRRALGQFDRTEAASAPLRSRADAARLAHEVCHGSRSISLLRWVLGRQLDQVVAVASEHLRMMTNGRYTVRRDSEGHGGGAKGLDLTIDDAHTGRTRPPTSLSGGEQFQASLALALGLADVVSRGASGNGRRIEALFIDEGFGSLDPRALDDAIDTLHRLRETGRMVGAITHVEAMKERLHPGIVVTRLEDGRGSTLVVNP